MDERKVTININVEFYPDENEELVNEPLDKIRQNLLNELEDALQDVAYGVNHLWWHFEEEN